MSQISVDIRKTLRTSSRDSLPHIPYKEIATSILCSGYELSVVICGDKLARKMNSKYRNKTYSPNVLSFPYEKTEGEIFLNIRKAEREARKYGTSTRSRAALLFVHGCFHLAGYKHGVHMEQLEQKILKKYDLASSV